MVGWTTPETEAGGFWGEGEGPSEGQPWLTLTHHVT